ncbi:hypothetical protein KMAL_21320 [Novacetimonas maltaceti]|uniref:Uncharacterized protein n=1 Tax=Novacetimonas maltaceti TaxID=1203393 RepID=A0A2S3W001_9PROT|nr:hypothetical protein KMAL_21320 [Novacetimonas maltaceti]
MQAMRAHRGMRAIVLASPSVRAGGRTASTPAIATRASAPERGMMTTASPAGRVLIAPTRASSARARAIIP